MPITPRCDKCKEELNEFGAILLSPPDTDSQVDKMHLCVNCYEDLMEIVKNNF
jgi:hypothetical protein